MDKISLDFINGEVLLFNKPLDWTSFDLVHKVRNLLCRTLGIKKLKVGHAGTLDPKATGLVVICTGKQTKNIDQIQAETKEYMATIKLGATTPSYDLETDEDQQYPINHINADLIHQKVQEMIGEIDQVPPIFSAIRINGKRAFDYARQGKEVEMKSRKIQIYNITVEEINLPFITLKITCSKGTYIRSIARDLGENLDSGGYLIKLTRTKIGNLLLEKSWDIENFEKYLRTNETN